MISSSSSFDSIWNSRSGVTVATCTQTCRPCTQRAKKGDTINFSITSSNVDRSFSNRLRSKFVNRDLWWLSAHLKFLKNLHRYFYNVFHSFCVLVHRSYVPSFVRIRQKCMMSSNWKKSLTTRSQTDGHINTLYISSTGCKPAMELIQVALLLQRVARWYVSVSS